MSMPASAPSKQPISHRATAPSERQGSLPAQNEEAAAALLQLEVMWYFGSDLSPLSRAASGAKAANPLSAAAELQASSLPWRSSSFTPATTSSSPPVKASSHAAFSSSKSLVSQANDGRYDHRKQALWRVFNTFDENGDGKVSIHEISGIFNKLGIESSTDQSLLASLVTKSEGHVDEQEFLSLYESVISSDASASSSSPQADMEQDLLDAFHVFDKDGNGFISPAELQSVLCSLGFPQGRQLEACVDMIARVDENGDGLVDFLEFKKLFHEENPLILIPSY